MVFEYKVFLINERLLNNYKLQKMFYLMSNLTFNISHKIQEKSTL